MTNHNDITWMAKPNMFGSCLWAWLRECCDCPQRPAVLGQRPVAVCTLQVVNYCDSTLPMPGCSWSESNAARSVRLTTTSLSHWSQATSKAVDAHAVYALPSSPLQTGLQQGTAVSTQLRLKSAPPNCIKHCLVSMTRTSIAWPATAACAGHRSSTVLHHSTGHAFPESCSTRAQHSLLQWQILTQKSAIQKHTHSLCH
jgi:hypothetical protein